MTASEKEEITTRMQLGDFVAEALSQIMVGVKKAQKEHNSTVDGRVNPRRDIEPRSEKTVRWDPHSGTLICDVEFDVAVTAVKGTKKEAGARVCVLSIDLGLRGQSDSSHSSVHRIKFIVPVQFPVSQPCSTPG